MEKVNACTKAIFVILFLVLALTGRPMALDYPTKEIQIVVPYPPGGTNDLTARILSPKLASILGQPVIVVNKPGGGGAVGIKSASASRPDGYTILTSPPGIVMIPILNPKIGFTLEDFIPVCHAVSTIYVIAVKADAPWKNLDELIKEAKKNPGKFTYSSAGHGTAFHFIGELFKMETGTDIVHVPMGGEALSVTGLLGGHVQMTFAGLGALSAHLKAGTLKPLAMLYPNRIKDFPGTPTIKELGYPALTTVGWYGYFVPAKTPEGIVEKLAKSFEAALKDKEIIANIEKAEMQVEGLFSGRASRFFQEEDKRWREVARKARIGEGGK